MECPRCGKSDTTMIGNSHYVCNDPTCIDENGNRTQFRLVIDREVKFPYNQIFVNRPIENFYKKPYLNLQTNNK